MNHARFMQVSDRYQQRMFEEYCRNREPKSVEELFQDWYGREWVGVGRRS